MATYQELRGLFTDSDLFEKMEVAIIISANNLIATSPTINDKAWAAHVFTSPGTEAGKALMAIIAENATLSTAQILAATDSTIQTKIDAITPILVDALAGV